MAHSALSAALRGSELTRKLLAFARKQSLQSTVVDLNDLVSSRPRCSTARSERRSRWRDLAQKLQQLLSEAT
jgi:hypothetical protein